MGLYAARRNPQSQMQSQMLHRNVASAMSTEGATPGGVG